MAGGACSGGKSLGRRGLYDLAKSEAARRRRKCWMAGRTKIHPVFCFQFSEFVSLFGLTFQSSWPLSLISPSCPELFHWKAAKVRENW